jgi:hypothetical protein
MLLWHDETCTSPSSASIATKGKQPPKTTIKLWARSNGRIKT